MRVCVILFAVVSVTSGSRIESKTARLVKLTVGNQCDPDETTCGGWWCCPYANWFCCPDYLCAATAADCPFEDKKTKLVKLLEETQCPDEWLTCPNGWCCPWADGFCCPDDWCAPTPAECPWSGCASHWKKMFLAFSGRILFVKFLSYLEKQFNHEFKIKSISKQ